MSKLQDLLDILAHADSFLAIETLAKQPDPGETMSLYQDLTKHLYWTEKNIPMFISISWAGIQYGLTEALAVEGEDGAKAYELRSAAKAIAYNLSSFVWPGWDEEGIVLGSAEIRLGLDAAKLNLRLAQDLAKGDLPLSRAYWMVGAQQMANRQYHEAESSFLSAAEYARLADVPSEALLAEAYGVLVGLLTEPSDDTIKRKLTSIKKQLANAEHGEAFISQINTAWLVFSQA